jgi:hypothetical protein
MLNPIHEPLFAFYIKDNSRVDAAIVSPTDASRPCAALEDPLVVEVVKYSVAEPLVNG